MPSKKKDILIALVKYIPGEMRIPPPHPIYIVDNLQIIEFLQDDILYLFHQELASNGQEKSSNGEEKKYS